jgi:hypothetical protein
VVAQAALALVLVVGSGPMIRTWVVYVDGPVDFRWSKSR